MLDISQTSREMLSFSKQKFSLNQLVRDIIDRMESLAQSSGNGVVLSELSHVEGDWDKFRIDQVVTNLMTNAIKYSPETQILVQIWNDNEHGYFSIQDFGIGIKPEDQDEIFKRYQRGTNVTSQRGLGIGLYISQQIIEKHSGRIDVQSEVNKGSKFIVKLPLREKV